jgi:hypothetical protein
VKPPASTAAPPTYQRRTAASTPGALLPPLRTFVWFHLLHAERAAFCMQEGGKIIPPVCFLIRLGQIGSGPAMWFPPVGRTDTSPALLAGLVPAHDKTDFVWGRD